MKNTQMKSKQIYTFILKSQKRGLTVNGQNILIGVLHFYSQKSKKGFNCKRSKYIDWCLTPNISSISAILWCEQILYIRHLWSKYKYCTTRSAHHNYILPLTFI